MIFDTFILSDLNKWVAEHSPRFFWDVIQGFLATLEIIMLWLLRRYGERFQTENISCRLEWWTTKISQHALSAFIILCMIMIVDSFNSQSANPRLLANSILIAVIGIQIRQLHVIFTKIQSDKKLRMYLNSRQSNL